MNKHTLTRKIERQMHIVVWQFFGTFLCLKAAIVRYYS